jgi:hypothetical protein
MKTAVIPTGLFRAVVATVPFSAVADSIETLSIPRAMHTFRSREKFTVVNAESPRTSKRITEFAVVPVVAVAGPELAVPVIRAVVFALIQTEEPDTLQIIDFSFKGGNRSTSKKTVAFTLLVKFLLPLPILR